MTNRSKDTQITSTKTTIQTENLYHTNHVIKKQVVLIEKNTLGSSGFNNAKLRVDVVIFYYVNNDLDSA